ncbi:TRAP transporter substrate-binding protein DctP [Fusobacterium animalis]|uniref:TRAP transporter substrate-binding protein DctP n=1 Tax=Fusobacterium animalis TaxID=76859 RepID=UPI0034DDECAA
MLKKIYKILVMIVCLLFLISCGEKKVESTGEKIKIKVAVIGNENHQSTIMADYFKEELEKLTENKFEIEIYPNGILGGEREAIEGVKLGTIQMTVVTMDGALPAWISDTQVMSIPYLFKSKEEAYKALDGIIYEYLSPKFEEQGFKYLGSGELGFRHFTNNIREIKTAQDMKGMSIRVQEAPVWFALIKSLGASAVPVSFNELYTALQQGMVDGEENPIASIYTAKFNEVQKYLTLDGHTYAAVSIVMNKSFYDGLDEELRNSIDKAAKAAIPRQREKISADENQYLEKLKESGMIVTVPDINSFSEATKDIYKLPEVEKLINPKFVDEVRKSLE